MLNLLKTFVRDLTYLFANYFIANIPCWTIRKILYKAMGMRIGKGTRICMKCIILSPWKISIGENTYINEYVLLDGRGGLQIGSNTNISMWGIIYTGSHSSNSPNFNYYSLNTKIGDCCWIGTRAVVMPGSSINNGAIISVNSVFKGETEQFGIYVGNPAKKMRNRNLSSCYTLKHLNYFK